MDSFFTQKRCDKCRGSLAGGRIMSAFDTSCICMHCSELEKCDTEYQKAVEADIEEIRKGNFNFEGIRGGRPND